MDIEKLIQKGESENTEFKQNFNRETLRNWGNQISQSTEPTVIPEIDLEDVKKYIKNANSSGRRRFEISEDPVRILEKLELLSEKKGRKYELR